VVHSGKRSYAEHAVETASPSSRLVMIIDLLEGALLRADRAYKAHDLYEIHCGLKNAQTIVALLRDSLVLDAWEGARDVYRLYEYALDRLVRSNLAKNPELLTEAEEVLRPLMDAWRQAAVLVGVNG